jgi:ribosomal protein S25
LGPTLPSRLVARVVEEMPAEETFSPSWIADEVNRRYPRELHRPIDSRLASTALRRMLAYGEVRRVEKGSAHREAIYCRR